MQCTALSGARSFYEVLERAAEKDFRVFAKVRLGDLVWMPRATRNRKYHWYRIAQKHVDFLLYDLRNLGPVLPAPRIQRG